MRRAYRMLSAALELSGLMLFPRLAISAERIYHWKDSGGVSCYSNTNAPKAATQFSVVSTAWPGAGRFESPDEAKDAGRDVTETPMAFDSRSAVLEERIERRRAAIHSIENLLRTHPDDTRRRRYLYRQKQSLQEDMIRLELLTK